MEIAFLKKMARNAHWTRFSQTEHSVMVVINFLKKSPKNFFFVKNFVPPGIVWDFNPG